MFTRIVKGVSIAVGVAFGALGLVALPFGALIGWSLLGLTIGLCVWQGAGQSPVMRKLTGSGRSSVTTGVMAGAAVMAVCLAVSGLVIVAGTTAAVSLSVMAAAAWVVWRFWWGLGSLRDGHDPPAQAAPEPVRDQAAVSALSTSELCLAWRRSYLELLRATDDPTRQRVVWLRREYLDELERRDREGFARWLGSGARAGSDPQRYLAAGG